MENKLDTSKIQIWKFNETLYTDDLLKEIDTNLNEIKLLYLNKNKYSILEKYVYDLYLNFKQFEHTVRIRLVY